MALPERKWFGLVNAAQFARPGGRSAAGTRKSPREDDPKNRISHEFSYHRLNNTLLICLTLLFAT